VKNPLPEDFDNYFFDIESVRRYQNKACSFAKIPFTMGVGRGRGGAWPPWILKFLEKKFVFLVLSGKKQISLLLAPPGKILEISPSAPLETSFRRPCHLPRMKHL